MLCEKTQTILVLNPRHSSWLDSSLALWARKNLNQPCGGRTTKRPPKYRFCPTPYFHLAFYGLCILLTEHGLRIVSKRWILLESNDSASNSLFWLYPLRPLYLINWTRPKCCVKKINSLVSFAPGDNFLFSLGILRPLYLILPFDIVFEFLSF